MLVLPLDIKQKKSARVQKKLQPQIQYLQKKYKNDKDKLSKKQMELYKQEGFNPLGGCLPVILQMFIFITYFGAIRSLSGVEMMRMLEQIQGGATEVLTSWFWVKNIWQPDTFLETATVLPNLKQMTTMLESAKILKDGILVSVDSIDGMTISTAQSLLDNFESLIAPFAAKFEGVKNGLFILPILAGGSSFIQFKLQSANTPTADTDSASSANTMTKMMKYMFPALSLFICSTSSSVFALYWLTSNLVSMASYLVMDKLLSRKEAEEEAVVVVED